MPLYTFIHNLLNVLVQIENKMGLQKNVYSLVFLCISLVMMVICKRGIHSSGQSLWELVPSGIVDGY
jgi:hypothetical protein